MTPDEVVIVSGKKRGESKSGVAQRAAIAARNKARKQRKLQKRAEAATGLKKSKQLKRQERQALARQQQVAAAEKKRQQAIEQKEREKARRAAFAEYSKTPEYAKKLARERAIMAAKKKSHLQAWVEEKTGLGTDRETLRQRWRERILRRSAKG